jgi:hypothetical protein
MGAAPTALGRLTLVVGFSLASATSAVTRYAVLSPTQKGVIDYSSLRVGQHKIPLKITDAG